MPSRTQPATAGHAGQRDGLAADQSSLAQLFDGHGSRSRRGRGRPPGGHGTLRGSRRRRRRRCPLAEAGAGDTPGRDRSEDPTVPDSGPHRLRSGPRHPSDCRRGSVRGGECLPAGGRPRAVLRAPRLHEHIHRARARVREPGGNQAMAATDGIAAARVALFAALADEPWSFDFFQALRRIEAVFPDRPRLGRALRPSAEPVRLSQEASVAFAPSTLSAFEEQEGALPPRLEQRFFGLLGPNGPLPLHLTEYARDRLLHHGDRTLARFLDLLHHRLALLFYRAWADARPAVQHDRPDEDRFAVYMGALAGYGTAATRDRDAVADHAKLFFVGRLARSARNAEGL